MKSKHKKIMYLGFFLGGIILLGLTGCGKAGSSSSVASSVNEKMLYQCSMHPQVISEKPGNCPICGMRLTKVASHFPVSVESHSKKVNERKILYYRHPMQPQVTSPVPSKDEMGMDFIPVYAQDAAAAESSQVLGHGGAVVSSLQQQWIGMKTAKVEERKLIVKIRTLGRVGYDPDQYSSISEYQEAAIAYKRFRGNPSSQVKEKIDTLHDLAMLKLRLAGLSDHQIEGLTNTGQLITHFTLEPDVRWLYADIYEQDSQLVHAGDKARVTAVSFPGKVFSGTVRSVDTLLNASNRMMRLRIQLDSDESLLRPGASVDVEVEAALGKKLSVPEDALVDTGEEKIVYVVHEENHIEPREVQVGYEADRYYEILSGLQTGEVVVSSAAFFVDSESRLRAASQSFSAAASEGNMPEDAEKEMPS